MYDLASNTLMFKLISFLQLLFRKGSPSLITLSKSVRVQKAVKNYYLKLWMYKLRWEDNMIG